MHETMRVTRMGTLGFSAALLVGACGGGGGSGSDGGTENLLQYTLVGVLAVDDSNPIAKPHEIEVLDSATGEPLDPPLILMSEPSTGKVHIDLPEGIIPSYHVVGSGTADEDSYDQILLNTSPDNGDTLFRVSTNGASMLANQTGVFENKDDHAPLAGAVFHTVDGVRVGSVGCAKVYLDDDTTGADESIDQRYSGSNSLPVTLDELDRTLRVGSRFYLANVPPGKHRLRASVDDGETFLGETEVVITRARQDAAGPSKLILYQVGIDIESENNPTPANCPEDPQSAE